MERNELKGKQTPGMAVVSHNRHEEAEVHIDGGEWLALFPHQCIKSLVAPCEANAALYAEAHNVANETGMWPLDMVERIKELEAAVGDPGFWGRAAARNGQRVAELEGLAKRFAEVYGNSYSDTSALAKYDALALEARSILNKK